MRILHTADWHLGATLGRNFSRISEQKIFIDTIIATVPKESIDLILIAGDIYDNDINAPIAAESLFFYALSSLSSYKIPIIIISGNHDNIDKLKAPSPLSEKFGIITITSPYDTPFVSNILNNKFSIKFLSDGCISITKDNIEAIIATMPFITEKRLNQHYYTATHSTNEHLINLDYIEKMRELFSKQQNHFKDTAINLGIGHFHILGTVATKSLHERDLYSGIYAIPKDILPNAQYIAMGHLHRSQNIGSAYYSGSPLAYSFSEALHTKYINIVEIFPNSQPVVKYIELPCTKPLKNLEAGTVSEVITMLENLKEEAWIYITITNEPTLNPVDLRKMRSLCSNIVNIELLYVDKQNNCNEVHHINSKELYNSIENDVITEFKDFYNNVRGSMPNEEVLKVFEELIL